MGCVTTRFQSVCFQSVMVQTRVKFASSSLNQCSSCHKLIIVVSCIQQGRGNGWILAQRYKKLCHGLGVLEQEVDKCRRLFHEFLSHGF